uniref:Glucosylceramidase n=1 Tax=Oncorhynchus kisutch TaxID=8019 RepID=A0A8C7CAQ2_ONCKI
SCLLHTLYIDPPFVFYCVIDLLIVYSMCNSLLYAHTAMLYLGQVAVVLSLRPLSLLANSWSVPTWLQTNSGLSSKGSLKGQPGGKEHTLTWTKYYYAKYNLSFWAVTTGNEPSAGQMTNYRPHLTLYYMYIHGVGVHWYLDTLVPAELSLGTTHQLYPEYYLFGTEACAGWSPSDRGVRLDSWERAEQYAHSIIQVLYCPMFYSMAHFRYCPMGLRVGVSFSQETKLESSAFIRPDGSVVLTILNRSSSEVQFEVYDPAVGFISSSAPAHSLLTLAWNTL